MSERQSARRVCRVNGSQSLGLHLSLRMSGRHANRDDRPVAGSPRNMDFSFKEFRPLAHAEQPDRHPVSEFLGRNALTVVLYLEQDLIQGLAEPNSNTGRVGMPGDIREGFLTDAKQCRGPFGI